MRYDEWMYGQDGSGEAKLRYGSPTFEVVRHGTYVVCAVTGARIALDDLRYWSAARQEAYVSPEAALRRHQECGAPGATPANADAAITTARAAPESSPRSAR